MSTEPEIRVKNQMKEFCKENSRFFRISFTFDASGPRKGPICMNLLGAFTRAHQI